MIDYVTWRVAFVIPGVLSVVVGIGLFVVWRAGWIKDVTKDRALSGAPDPSAFVRVFIVLTITMACTGFVYTGLTNTMPKLMEMGLSAAMASSYTEIGIFVGIVSGIASLSSIFGGWMADRYSARAIYIVFWVLQIPLLFVIVSLSDYTLLAGILLWRPEAGVLAVLWWIGAWAIVWGIALIFAALRVRKWGRSGSARAFA